ncbi:MAG: HAD hydrolase-like protein, partial [Gammaproteobacteria bacterium]|nr:HAD hydrolase-like protein [Gammaproteobacteria bacterium]
MTSKPLAAVLFDLDGTLADTAIDLAAALNQLLLEEGRAALPEAVIRPHVSHGTPALLGCGFGIDPQHPNFATLRLRLLALYEATIPGKTTLFPGIEALLQLLEAHAIPWGVVTNKPAFLTDPLLKGMQL